jgi:hypothetical protein
MFNSRKPSWVCPSDLTGLGKLLGTSACVGQKGEEGEMAQLVWLGRCGRLWGKLAVSPSLAWSWAKGSGLCLWGLLTDWPVPGSSDEPFCLVSFPLEKNQGKLTSSQIRRQICYLGHSSWQVLPRISLGHLLIMGRGEVRRGRVENSVSKAIVVTEGRKKPSGDQPRSPLGW